MAKKKRRSRNLKSRLRKPFPQKKRFNGKIYTCVGVFPKGAYNVKTTIKQQQEDYHKRGYLAEIYEKKWGYGLYVKEKHRGTNQSELIVHRKGFERKAFDKIDPRTGKKIHIPSTDIPPTTFSIKDRGAKGRGKKVIPEMKEGKMTEIAKKHGYISKDGNVGDIPYNKMDNFARDVVKEVGATKAKGMFQAQEVLRKRKPNDPFKKKMEKARKTVTSEFHKELAEETPERAHKPGYKEKKIRKKHPKTGTEFETTVWTKEK